MKRISFASLAVAGTLVALLLTASLAGASSAPTASSNVPVTDQTYVSADVMGGTGNYSDGVLTRCSTDNRQQNEPTLAIDPRNPSVWTSGSNDYCTTPTAGDAWAGFYRSTDSGGSWTDSLLPGYAGDTSPQGMSSPLRPLVLKGSIAAGDPVQAWDGSGDVFYMGNNFSRGTENGVSGRFRNNIGSIWVATYAPADPNDTSTDGSRYVRTVILAQNTFGEGSFNDKTDIAADPVSGNVYAAWSDFHGSACNQILFSRSTDGGQTFSQPLKLSSGICNNQGPSIAIGTGGNVYVAWEGSTGGTFMQHAVTGAAFVSSSNYGATFSKARLATIYTPFTSEEFSGNGARECGDAPFNCPTGYTFPRFDLAGPYLAADNVNGTLVMGFQAAQSDGQGQIEYSYSTNGGTSWSSNALLDPSPGNGHQFFPYLTASAGRVSAIWYDSRNDPNYAPTRAPCNDANGLTYPCVNVRYAESSDGGETWSPSIPVTDTPTNPNLEQFGGRLVPFFGDYITVAAQGDTVGAVWTDQRDAALGAEQSGTDQDGADVAGDPETVGGTCTSSVDTCFDTTSGLDQNIYASTITP
jgi:hypothetical protein